LSPGNSTAAYNLALAYQHLGRFDDATKWVRKALESNPRDLSLQSLEWWVRVLKWRNRLARLARTCLGLRRPV
ncbi:MAG TPA: tetratricopeptide repeat protein, partial [Tepidisphaeraceae bacterium]|nr:tetratricopeptide repeat protein [Tepidisphaeraceae bacterium]